MNNDYELFVESLQITKQKQLYIKDLHKILYPNLMPRIVYQQENDDEHIEGEVRK